MSRCRAAALLLSGMLAGCASQPAAELKLSYPEVQPVGDAERAMSCAQLAAQVEFADAIRRSVVHDWGPGAKQAAGQTALGFALLPLALVPGVNAAMNLAGLAVELANSDEPKGGGAYNAYAAYRNAESRVLALVTLRQHAACPPAFPGEALTAEATLLAHIPQLDADLKARRMKRDDYLLARVEAFDQLRPQLPPSVAVPTTATPGQAPEPAAREAASEDADKSQAESPSP